MFHAELAPDAARSARLRDSLVRAARLAARGGRVAGLADLVRALLDDPDVAVIWAGIDTARLADQLRVLAVRDAGLDDLERVLEEADALAASSGEETGALHVLSVVVQGHSAVASILRSHGRYGVPTSVEPEIPGFDLEEALSGEDLEEVDQIVEELDDLSEDGALVGVPVDDFFLGTVTEKSGGAKPEPQAEAEPTGPFEAVPPPAPPRQGASSPEQEPQAEPELERAAKRRAERDEALAPETPAPVEPGRPEDTWTDFTPPPVSRAPDGAPAGGSVVRSGQLAHDVPETMMVARKVTVRARLAEGENEALTEGMEGASVQGVQVTKAMTVRLVAPDGGFLVEESSPSVQWVYGAPEPTLQQGPAEWGWTVTPTKRGTYRLRLVISARTVDAQGTSAETALPDQIVDVRVTANVARTALHVAGWAAATVVGGAVTRFGGDITDWLQDWLGM